MAAEAATATMYAAQAALTVGIEHETTPRKLTEEEKEKIEELFRKHEEKLQEKIDVNEVLGEDYQERMAQESLIYKTWESFLEASDSLLRPLQESIDN